MNSYDLGPGHLVIAPVGNELLEVNEDEAVISDGEGVATQPVIHVKSMTVHVKSIDDD